PLVVAVYVMFDLLFRAPAAARSDTLSLHDALPICERGRQQTRVARAERHAAAAPRAVVELADIGAQCERQRRAGVTREVEAKRRSEEHTSELQSRSDLVCRLLLEKKNHVTELHMI